MSENKNVLFVGVGGQGTILASKILTLGLLEAGYDVKMSEVHGMAFLSLSADCHVRPGTARFNGCHFASLVLAPRETEPGEVNLPVKGLK